jgi:hypothetical protein
MPRQAKDEEEVPARVTSIITGEESVMISFDYVRRIGTGVEPREKE